MGKKIVVVRRKNPKPPPEKLAGKKKFPPRPTGKGLTMTAEDEKKLRELHAQNFSCGQIAKEIQVSVGTVSNWAKRLGIFFDREKTRAAVEATVLDNKARRALLASKLLDDAENLRLLMYQPQTVFSFGGRDNVYSEAVVDSPPPQDKRSLMMAAKAAIDTSVRLDEYDSQENSDGAKSMLGKLSDELGSLAEKLEQENSEDEA